MQQIPNKILFILLLCVSFLGIGQEVSFTASVSRKSIGINERLSIDFTMNQNGDHFTPPSFTDFEVIMGPSQSVSHSWINGQKSYSKTYTFVLAPLKQGKLNIESASVLIQGKEYYTKPIQVEVTQAVDKPQQQAATQHSSGGFPFGFDPFGSLNPMQEETNTETLEITEKELFITTEVSKKSPYLNEPISVIYKVFVDEQLGVRGLQMSSVPKYNNFWKQEIPMQEYQIEKVVRNGKKFVEITIKKVVLYGQKAENITIEPLEAIIALQVPTNKVDIFGRRFYDSQQKEIRSEKLNIKVKNLPEEGKPTDFSGAVGQFELATSLSKHTLQAGESAVAKVFISGKGNFKLFQTPKLSFPSALEVYDPEEKDNTKISISGMYGDVSYLYPIVPQSKGKYPIPGVSFSYFDPETEKYITKNSYELLLDVQGSDENTTIHSTNISTPKKTSANEAFQFIKQNANWKKIDEKPLFGSWLFFVYMFLPLLLLPLLIWLVKAYRLQQEETEENTAKLKGKLSKKYLSSAKEHLTHKEKFYEDLERCLHAYLKAKLRLQTTELSKENIRELLQSKNTQIADIEQLISLIRTCEEARYAPLSVQDTATDFARAEQIITMLDKQLKK